MPLTDKGVEIKKNMEEQYGKEKGERVFYASKTKGTISGVDRAIVSTYRGMSGDQQPPLVTTPNAGLPAGLTREEDDED
ncbi:MAG TPA: hypothetical protein VGF65_11335 [Mycobacterium sp.]|jgi:hypothetical protein